MHRAALVGGAVAVLAGGCLPHKTGWNIDFEVSGDLEKAVRVEVQILEGDCDTGTSIYEETLFLPQGPRVESPPDLDKGDYCFMARASDILCRVYAEDRRTVHLPRDEDVKLVLSRLASPESLCDAGVSCLEGRCAAMGTSCAEGFADCNGMASDGCETRLDRIASCGACGRACQDFQQCERLINGVHDCTSACPLLTECGQACTDVRVDPLHCGGCDVACPIPENGTGRCEGGTCSSSCLPGYSDCDGSDANGCETLGGCP